MSDPTSRAGANKRSPAAQRRRDREASIIAATRELFDARGLRDAQIEDVARAVGINRTIIYRHFTGKEELFALTMVDYLKDLDVALAEADDAEQLPQQRLATLTEVFIDFGLAHPAFVDCGVTVLRMGPALLDELSASALYRVGKAMTSALSRVVAVLEAGQASQEFLVDDADQLANMFYAMGLGGLQLARLGVMVKQTSPRTPAVAQLDQQAVKKYLVAASLALVAPR